MKFLFKFIPFQILVLLCIGIWIQYYFPVDHSYATYAFVCCAGLLCLKSKKLFKIGIFIVPVFIGMFSMQLQQPKNLQPDSEKKLKVFVIDKILNQNNFSKNYVAIYQSGNSKFYDERVILTLYTGSVSTQIIVGDRILTKASLEEVPERRNPFDFDYKNYLKQKNIIHQVKAKKWNWLKCAITENSIKSTVYGYRQKLIYALKEKIDDPDVLAISLVLVIGDRNYIDAGLKQNYVNAGVIHILAVSGLHIGMLVFMLLFLLKPLQQFKNGKIISFFIIVLILWGYALLAGLSASVVRAVTMFSFVSLGMVFEKKNNIFYTLVTSALVLLLVHPFFLFDLGFQMSYLAVLSIVVLFPVLNRIWSSKNKLVGYFWKLSLVSLSAQIGLLPLTLHYFHQFPGLFLISNLLVLPMLGVVLLYGFVVLFAAVFNIDFEPLYQLYSWIVSWMNDFIAFVSEQDAWLFSQIYFSKRMMISGYLIVICVAILLHKISLRNIYRLGSVLIIFQLMLFFELYQRKNKSVLMVCDLYKKSLIIEQQNNRAKFNGINGGVKNKQVKNYLNASGVTLDTAVENIPSIFKYQQKRLLVIDSLGFYKVENLKGSIVLLRNSPKINLERCISYLEPRMIIADGSNYSYIKQRWKNTCSKMNIDFHDTRTQGAFIIK